MNHIGELTEDLIHVARGFFATASPTIFAGT
jgi:hypothetical protein